ncbi:IDEAL domain-containing protein [Paenibacillus agricola]
MLNTNLERSGLEVGSMGKMNISNDTMLGLFAEMVLDESIRKYKEHYLYKEIDLALAKGDEVTFLALTTELKSLYTLGNNDAP